IPLAHGGRGQGEGGWSSRNIFCRGTARRAPTSRYLLLRQGPARRHPLALTEVPARKAFGFKGGWLLFPPKSILTGKVACPPCIAHDYRSDKAGRSRKSLARLSTRRRKNQCHPRSMILRTRSSQKSSLDMDGLRTPKE